MEKIEPAVFGLAHERTGVEVHELRLEGTELTHVHRQVRRIDGGAAQACEIERERKILASVAGKPRRRGGGKRYGEHERHDDEPEALHASPAMVDDDAGFSTV